MSEDSAAKKIQRVYRIKSATAKKEAPNGSNEALMALRGKRFVYSQELETHGPLNMAFVKKLIEGNDNIIFSRDLLPPMSPMWHIFVPNNEIPRLSQDDGERRRIVNQSYDSIWGKNLSIRSFVCKYTVYIKNNLTRWRQQEILKVAKLLTLPSLLPVDVLSVMGKFLV